MSFNVQKNKNERKKSQIIQNRSSTDVQISAQRKKTEQQKSKSSLLSVVSVGVSATVGVHTVPYLFKSSIQCVTP